MKAEHRIRQVGAGPFIVQSGAWLPVPQFSYRYLAEAQCPTAGRNYPSSGAIENGIILPLTPGRSTPAPLPPIRRLIPSALNRMSP